MSQKTTDVVAYLTWIGLVVAFLAGDRRGSHFHLNQALVLKIAGTAWLAIFRVAFLVIGIASFGLLIGLVLAVNALVSLILLVLTIMGLVNAIQGVEKPLPLIGGIVLYR